jgi:hypothetical protein
MVDPAVGASMGQLIAVTLGLAAALFWLLVSTDRDDD